MAWLSHPGLLPKVKVLKSWASLGLWPSCAVRSQRRPNCHQSSDMQSSLEQQGECYGAVLVIACKKQTSPSAASHEQHIEEWRPARPPPPSERTASTATGSASQARNIAESVRKHKAESLQKPRSGVQSRGHASGRCLPKDVVTDTSRSVGAALKFYIWDHLGARTALVINR